MTPDRNLSLPYEVEERLRRALAAAAAGDGLRTPDHVEKALVAALRRRNRRLLAWRIGGAGSIAAAILAGLIFSRPPARVASAPVAAVSPAPALPVKAPAAPLLAKSQSLGPKRPKPAVAVAARKVPAVASTGFIPVGQWQAMEPMERGSIIRVRLPKSSLPGFGIPVSADRWNESIPADVVLAEDGSMRAVRFVSAVQ